MTEIMLSEANDRVRFTLVQAGLDHISQGFTVFDSDLRLVGWNRTFFSLLNFPIEMGRVGTPFADFMYFNARRGEYGDGNIEELVAARVAAARTFQPHQIERLRPNGQIIAVRGEPLPEGGFVTIYTDVTEQRRYERLIREQTELLDARVKERTAELEAANADLKRASEDQKRAEAALVQAQKMEAVGKLTSGIAHDFNNLLTIIIGNLAALPITERPDFAENIAPALGAARRGADLIRRLLAFSRQQPLEPLVINVPSSLAGLMPLLRRSLPETIEIDAPLEIMPKALVRVDPNHLDNAILNLALNARDAMVGGGILRIDCKLQVLRTEEAAEIDCQVGSYICTSVCDNGSGMSGETIARAFEPFFTTKEFGRSSGLGLSMVYGFARQSGGGIRLHSTVGKGTTVRLYLPQATASEQKQPRAKSNEHSIKVAPRLVLLVEDEPEVRRVIRGQLQELGQLVLEARDASEALTLLAQSPEIALMVSDVVMPGGLSGVDLALASQEKRPDVNIILMTGHTGWPHEATGEATPWPVLNKPFSSEELARAIKGDGRGR